MSDIRSHVYDKPFEAEDQVEYVAELKASNIRLAAEKKTAYKEIERLRKQYQECIHDLQDWGAYASPYFQEKHDFHGCIAQHEANLKEKVR